MKRSKQGMLLYDDGCPMCTFQTRALTWLDWFHVVSLVPLSHPKSAEVAPTLDPAALREAIHFIAPDGTVYRGARAFRHLGLRIPVLIPLGLFLWFPGVIWVAERIYMWISRNRHLFSRVFGCNEACSVLPARERDGDLEAADVHDG